MAARPCDQCIITCPMKTDIVELYRILYTHPSVSGAHGCFDRENVMIRYDKPVLRYPNFGQSHMQPPICGT